MSDPSEADRERMRLELGSQRWEAVGHFPTDGDYLGANERDFRGAIAAYENAWGLLFTPWQQRTGGADILAGIADWALLSEDPELAAETLGSLSSRASLVNSAKFNEALRKLTLLAEKPPGPA